MVHSDPGSSLVPRLSIVIPVLGDPQQLDDTLFPFWKIVPPIARFLSSTTSRITTLTTSAMRCDSSRPRGAGHGRVRQPGLRRQPIAGGPRARLRRGGLPRLGRGRPAAFRQSRHRGGGRRRARPRRLPPIVSAGWGYRVEGTAWKFGRQNDPADVPPVRKTSAGRICWPPSIASRRSNRPADFRRRWATFWRASIWGCRCGTPASAACWSRSASLTRRRAQSAMSRRFDPAATPNGSFGAGRRAAVGCRRWPATLRSWPASARSACGGLRCSSDWPAGCAEYFKRRLPKAVPNPPNPTLSRGRRAWLHRISPPRVFAIKGNRPGWRSSRRSSLIPNSD